ncbi:DNA polymerase III subunit delta [Hartmannibacter diazotrophicus]|uniref:DNA-directed DNA polymerase n=1 Tax=Hartmannibacter diazotrophicus TaxID=1482074 RepID=A0A2C9DD53_9HYPH|nr:DNA polymerase III subunit delta [Hartmannibacter diazotrophicus]SON58176.1 DNA polymerase III subunit delta [Hartmannibacter diazotrophicus]
MVAAKAADADRIAASPPAGISLFLVYGPDTGLVSERSEKIAAARCDAADPFSLIRLDGTALAQNASLLADEAYAVSMFGGRRTILVRDAGGRTNLAPIIAPLIANPPPETTVVVEGGDLKKSNPLRSLFEKEKLAYAIACYVDDEAAVGRLIEEETHAAGLTIEPEARRLLISLLGGDRLASRGEIVKLCLFAHGKGQITVADVEEVTGDAASVTLDEILDATALGDLETLVQALSRSEAEGIRADVLAGAVLRHFQTLDLARSDVDAGATAQAAVSSMRPPVFFKRADKMARSLNIWNQPRLARALELLSAAARDCRLNAHLAPEILTQTLLTIARAARR